MGRVASRAWAKRVCWLVVFAFAFALLAGTAPVVQRAYAQDGQLTAAMPADTSADQAKDATYTTVARVKLNKTTGKIKNNGTLKLKATLVPADASLPIKDKTVTWRFRSPRWRASARAAS